MKEPPAQPNFPEIDNNIAEYWHTHDIETKYRHKNNNAPKRFGFLDGPITANNPMGVHHALGRTIKDFYQRYHTMLGYKQRYQNGFDCQGLWVEVEEEKDLGFNSKLDIENFGIDKFSRSCRARVDRFSKVQTEQSKRLGMFMDWDNSYYTMSENNNLHIWHFLKIVNDKGWLYKGIDAMPWCTRCGTAISQHELSDGGYKDVTHETVYVRFTINESKIKERILKKYNLDPNKPISFLVWTTTPWTLLANTAIAVNKSVQYGIFAQNDEYIVLAENRDKVLDSVGSSKQMVSISGVDLIDILGDDRVYIAPFNELPTPNSNAAEQIISWDDVSDTEGTGIVHIAPSAGKDDFELGKINNLGFANPSIDEFGNYLDGFGLFTGQSVFAVRSQIYESLKTKGYFYKTEQIQHSYPHCWRCKHELVFRTTLEWFIKSDDIRPLMKKAAASVNWMPDHAGKRMQDWLDNMGDWPISRKRYWGLALPFYQNEDGSKHYVVGGKDELRQLAMDPLKVDNLPEFHRPWIDKIELDGSKIIIDGEAQTGIWKRVKDVGDCWLDAGIVPFSTVDYLSNPQNWEQWYPFDFITEGVAQIKLWFYATLFMSVTLKGVAPWKNVLATGFLVDETGKAMHKSAGNSIALDEAANRVGADAIRWLYLRERVSNYHGNGNLRFGYQVLDDVRRRFLVIYYNTYRFFVQNAIVDGWDPDTDTNEPNGSNVLDKWLLSKLAEIQREVDDSLQKYDSPTAADLMETFVVNDFSQWYIRRSRNRVGPNCNDSKDKTEFYRTAYLVLRSLNTLLAPFIPFISEEMYLNLKRKNDPQSVHLTQWPESILSIDQKIIENMNSVRIITERIHAKRKELGIKVRQPLRKAQVEIQHDLELSSDLVDLILDEVNIKSIELRIDTKTNEITVELDTKIDTALKNEGLVREIIRQVQTMRRTANMLPDQLISANFNEVDDELSKAITDQENFIKAKIQARTIIINGLIPEDSVAFEIDGKNITICIQKV